MTVLKSFELNGNKQSFANWISNLSPCDTPFTSMVGKEGINEVQYSWQTDTLAPADNTSYEEGSQAEFQKRAATKVVHNFTSILRKVVHISDTIAALDTYGRNSEVSYQMGKSGKELKRDIEFMCLNNGIGNVGTSAVASKFSGFEHLCALDGVADTDTGAVTTKSITVADLKGPWFKTSDVFGMTYNLYLSGSKANKIMFHPCHATTFSDFMSHNIETPLAYRMFDGLDDKFNTKVSRIRDPLGREYDLIPNRHMPKDKLYFFTESDWTQMILRQPAVSPLAKRGSSDSYLLETEIGLRHKNPHASGVLSMEPSTLIIEWIAKPSPLTAGIEKNEEAIISIKTRATGNPVADGTVVNWKSSNPLVVEVADPTGQTNSGQANVLLKPRHVGTSIITAYNADGHASYLVTVANPGVILRVPSPLMEVNQKSLLDVYVTDHAGVGVADVSVSFTATPGHLVEMDTITTVTDGTGTAKTHITAKALGLVQVHAVAGGVSSNYGTIHIVEKVEQLSMEIDQKELAHNVNDVTLAVILMRNAAGAGIQGKSVTLVSSDTGVISPTAGPFTTDVKGVVEVALTAKGVGDTVMIAGFEDQTFEIQMAVRPPIISLEGPEKFTMNTPFDMEATITRSDGSPLGHADVTFTSVPPFSPPVADVQADIQGIATARYTPTSNTDLEVTASVGGYGSNKLEITEQMP